MAFDDRQQTPLNVQPIGLLDVLRVRNGGRYPQIMGTTLQPTWDLSDHYMQTNAYRDSQGLMLTTGNGFYVTMVGAQATHWRRMLELSVLWTGTNAADRMFADFVMWDPNAAVIVPRSLQPFKTDQLHDTTVGVSSSLGLVGWGNSSRRNGCGPYWLPPGWAAGLFVLGCVSTGNAAALRWWNTGQPLRA